MDNAIIDAIEKEIGYRFKDKSLLELAFTHSSYAYEHNVESNEKLEFLGDGALNFIVADILYTLKRDEGEMTRMRSNLVSRTPLAKEIERMDLMKYMRFGDGVDVNTASVKLVSNLYEAIVAAVYKDGGLDAARNFIKNTLLKYADIPQNEDSKTLLQEFLQARGKKVSYKDECISENPPLFASEAIVDGKVAGKGRGTRKKSAQMEAAYRALCYLQAKIN